MYEHSIKVPRLYKLAAKIVKDFKENGANVKELIFRSRGEVNYIYFRLSHYFLF